MVHKLYEALGVPDFGDKPVGLEDLEVITGLGPGVAVPYSAGTHLRQNVLAASVTTQLGNKSIDYTRKRYSEHWPSEASRTPQKNLALAITAEALQVVKAEITSYVSIPNKPDHPGMISAGACLYRLVMSFRLATLAIRNGFHFETAVLCRLILEQLAWAYKVHGLTDNKVFDYAPHKCIRDLKVLFPAAGALYGDLSETAHIMPELSLRYLDLTSTSDAIVVLSHHNWMPPDALTVYRLADMYSVVAETCYASLLSTLRHTVRSGTGDIGASPEREGFARLGYWSDVVGGLVRG